MTLTRVKLTAYLVKTLKLGKEQAEPLTKTFFEEIALGLERGEDVKISGFGNFKLRDKKQRAGKNPKTGKAVAITARRVVTFRAGKKLRSLLAQRQGVS